MAVEDKKEEILTINECAELLKVSPWLIYGLVSEEREFLTFPKKSEEKLVTIEFQKE